MGKDKRKPAAGGDAGAVADAASPKRPKAQRVQKAPKPDKAQKPEKTPKPPKATALPDPKGVKRAVRQLERRVADATKAERKLARQLETATRRRARLADQLSALAGLSDGTSAER